MLEYKLGQFKREYLRRNQESVLEMLDRWYYTTQVVLMLPTLERATWYLGPSVRTGCSLKDIIILISVVNCQNLYQKTAISKEMQKDFLFL